MEKVLIQEKSWKLSSKFDESTNKTFLFLENTKTGFCDYPVLHTDKITFDKPERIPKYILEKITKYFFTHFAFYRLVDRLVSVSNVKPIE
jgi:hypothetical protein